MLAIFAFSFIALFSAYIIKEAANDLERQMMAKINPEITLFSPYTVKNDEEFVQGPDFDHHQELAIYEELKAIQDGFTFREFDTNVMTGSYVFLLPMFNGEFLIQEEDAFLNEMSFARIKAGTTLFGGDYNRLTSTTSDNINNRYLNKETIIEGRTFNSGEMKDGEDVIVLGNPAYIKQGEKKTQVAVGDQITYALFLRGINGRYIAYEHDFTVVGILDNRENCRLNFVPEKSFFRLIEDIEVLVKEEMENNGNYEGLISFLPQRALLNSLDDFLAFDTYISDYQNFSYLSDISDYIGLYGQIKAVEKSFDILLIVALVFNFGIVIFFLYAEMEGRIKEIGIWLALGLSKKTIFKDFLIEYSLLYLAALSMAFLSVRGISANILLGISPLFKDLDMGIFLNYKDIVISLFLLLMAMFGIFALIFVRCYKMNIKEVINNEGNFAGF